MSSNTPNSQLAFIESIMMKKLLKGLTDTTVDIHLLTSNPISANPGEIAAVDNSTYYKFYRVINAMTDLTKDNISTTNKGNVAPLVSANLANNALSSPTISNGKINFDTPTGTKSLTLPPASDDTAGIISKDDIKAMIGDSIASGVPDAGETTKGKVSKQDIKDLISSGITSKMDTSAANSTYFSNASLSGNTLTLTTPNGTSKTVDLSHFVDTLTIPSDLFKGAEVSAHNLVFTKEDGSQLTVDLSTFVDKVPVSDESTNGTISWAKVKELASSEISNAITAAGNLKNKLDAMSSKEDENASAIASNGTKINAAIKDAKVSSDGNNLQFTKGDGTSINVPLTSLTPAATDSIAGVISKQDIKSLISTQVGANVSNAYSNASYSNSTHAITLTRNSGNNPTTIDLSDLYIHAAQPSDIFQ